MRKIKYSHNQGVLYKYLRLRTNRGSEQLFSWIREDSLCKKDILLFPHGSSQIDKYFNGAFKNTKYYYLKPDEKN